MLAGRLQRRTTTLATRMEDAFRVRLHLPSAPGSGAALCQELRASSRRSHRPTAQPKRQERTQNWIKLGGNVSCSGGCNVGDDLDRAGSGTGPALPSHAAPVAASESPLNRLQSGESRTSIRWNSSSDLQKPRHSETWQINHRQLANHPLLQAIWHSARTTN